ncbi:SUKH-4 family immunity protein (plasmid) [Streptomyces sp. BI20]|uniref:SUKH-4 family immunity protein n=1 Tax=Streptomyces sp. BI20 TaxID=3403460 RepID=UPI003C75D662
MNDERMTEDARIAAVLGGCAHVPYPGVWRAAPFVERVVDGVCHALVAVDPGAGAIGLRRDGGSLWLLPEGGAARLLNSDLAAFVAFDRAYGEASVEAEAEAEERAAEESAEALTARFRALDPAAVADENAFWNIAAEELGYGAGGA